MKPRLAPCLARKVTTGFLGRWLAVVGLLAVVGCGGDGTSTSNESAPHGPPVVFVVNPFLEDVVARLAGDSVELVYPIPRDADPSDWQPSDEDVRAIQRADAILLNGAHFSKWIRRVSLPTGKLFDTSRDFRDEYVRVEDFSVHSHGESGEHSHPGTAPNTFLDPRLAIRQAASVRDVLKSLLPELHAEIDARYEQLVAELREIDAEYELATNGAARTAVYASHPFCSYVARRANWDVVHLHWSPDEMPSEAKWSRLEEGNADRRGRWMLWTSPPTPEIAERLEELGITSIVLRTAPDPSGGDGFPAVLRANLERIRPVLEGERDPLAESDTSSESSPR